MSGRISTFYERANVAIGVGRPDQLCCVAARTLRQPLTLCAESWVVSIHRPAVSECSPQLRIQPSRPSAAGRRAVFASARLLWLSCLFSAYVSPPSFYYASGYMRSLWRGQTNSGQDQKTTSRIACQPRQVRRRRGTVGSLIGSRFSQREIAALTIIRLKNI